MVNLEREENKVESTLRNDVGTNVDRHVDVGF